VRSLVQEVCLTFTSQSDVQRNENQSVLKKKF